MQLLAWSLLSKAIFTQSPPQCVLCMILILTRLLSPTPTIHLASQTKPGCLSSHRWRSKANHEPELYPCASSVWQPYCLNETPRPMSKLLTSLRSIRCPWAIKWPSLAVERYQHAGCSPTPVLPFCIPRRYPSSFVSPRTVIQTFQFISQCPGTTTTYYTFFHSEA